MGKCLEEWNTNMIEHYQVAIIGGGVVGNAVARELSRYKLKICVIERENDVLHGVSGRNTGLLHSGILNEKGTLRKECVMEGNEEFDQVAKELGIPFIRCGKLIVGFGEKERERLDVLYQRGLDNGVPQIRMIDAEEIRKIEPNAKGEYAIHVPSPGIMDPFTYTIALAENAVMNGVKYFFGYEVTGINRQVDDTYVIKTDRGDLISHWVINCAGLSAFKISPMLGFAAYETQRIKGEYAILDKKLGKYLSLPIYPTPNEQGAFDVHVTPTVDGNILVGPTIQSIGTGLDYNATQEMIDELKIQGENLFSYARPEFFIRNYAGVFPTIKDTVTNQELDFQIQTSPKNTHAINLVAITSPGLSSALPIARRVVQKLKQNEQLIPNEKFDPTRKGIIKFHKLSKEEQAQLIEEDPEYGEIFCRCECVTKAEVRQALNNPLGVKTISGIKYRTRASAGRCQGGYCETRLTSMLQEDFRLDRTDIILGRKGSYLFTGKVK